MCDSYVSYIRRYELYHELYKRVRNPRTLPKRHEEYNGQKSLHMCDSYVPDITRYTNSITE